MSAVQSPAVLAPLPCNRHGPHKRALVRSLPRAGRWEALSSDGVTIYRVRPDVAPAGRRSAGTLSCTCPAGKSGGQCYHWLTVVDRLAQAASAAPASAPAPAPNSSRRARAQACECRCWGCAHLDPQHGCRCGCCVDGLCR